MRKFLIISCLCLAIVFAFVPLLMPTIVSADVENLGNGYYLGSLRFQTPNATVFDGFPLQVIRTNASITNLWEDDFITIESNKLGYSWENFSAYVSMAQSNSQISLRIDTTSIVNLQSLQLIVLGANLYDSLFVNGYSLQSYSMETSNFLQLIVSGKGVDNTDDFEFSIVTGDVANIDTVGDDIYYEFDFTNPSDNVDMSILGFIVKYSTLNAIDEAYQNGYQDATNTFNSTINSIKQNAYNDGYYDGLENAEQATLFAMFTSIFDGLVTMITGLLDFNFMGYNMLSLFKFIFTVGLVMLIFKIFNGGGNSE